MPDKKCPNCGLWNAGIALLCDCGYDFASGKVTQRTPTTAPRPLTKVPSVSNEDFSKTSRQTVEVIGFGRRLVAYGIDGIVWSIILLILQFGAGIAVAPDSDAYYQIAFCLPFLTAPPYFVGFWATKGQTPGKMVMRIKVISTDGQSVSWGKALLRYVGYIISGLVVLPLGFIWAAFDAKRQGWHDKIARTYVVREETHFTGTEPITFVPSDPGSSAILAILLVYIPLLCLVAVVVISILALLGPAVGNVFSNIVENR